MRRAKIAAANAPARKVLVAAVCLNQRLLDYTANLCRRIGADGVDVLWLQTPPEIPPLFQAFIRKLQQEQIACRLLHRPGGLRREVLRQVARDRRVTVVVVNSLEERDGADKSKPARWWTQLPCPLVVVEPGGEQRI